MIVRIVTFPATRVAVIRHRGAPQGEHATARKLIEWKLRHRLLDQERYRSYGLHYTDPRRVAPADHRVDFCLSIDVPVEPNDEGITVQVIPELRCAVARHIGSRADNQAARFLYHEWLPTSGERVADYPMIFHYVNVGPNVREEEAITDVYLPLAPSGETNGRSLA